MDLTNMDERSAKEYVIALLTTIKETGTKRKQLEKEVELWRSRVHLAREHSRQDLELQAAEKAEEKQSELDGLIAEENEYIQELRTAKVQLEAIKNQPSLSINPDLLLAELEMVVGEPDTASEKFKEFEAEQALDELKKQLGSDRDK